MPKKDYTELVTAETEMVLPSQAILQIKFNVSHGKQAPEDLEIAGLGIVLNSLKPLIMNGIKGATAESKKQQQALEAVREARKPFNKLKRAIRGPK